MVQARYVVATLSFVALVICYLDRVNISIAIIPMTEVFKWTPTDKGIIISSFFYGYIASMVPGGLMADKYGGNTVLSIAVVWWSLWTVLTPTLARYGFRAIILSRAMIGLGQGVAFPAAMSTVSRWFNSSEAAFISSVVTGGAMAGAVLAQLIGPPLIINYGWESIFTVFGYIGFVWYGVNKFLNKEPSSVPLPPQISQSTTIPGSPRGTPSKPHPEKSSTRALVRFLLTAPACWAIYASSFAHGWQWWTTLFWFPSYLHDTFHVDMKMVGFYSIFPIATHFFVASAVARKSEALIKNGTSVVSIRKWANTIGGVGCSIGLAIIPFCTTLNSAVITMTLCWFFGSWQKCGYACNAFDISPKNVGVIFGSQNVFNSVPGIFGMILVGYILEVTGDWRLVFYIPAAIGCVGCAIYHFLAEGRVLFV